MESHTFKVTERDQFLRRVGSEWADSLLSLAFATWWNPKHPSYKSSRLFLIPSRLYDMFKATGKSRNDYTLIAIWQIETSG